MLLQRSLLLKTKIHIKPPQIKKLITTKFGLETERRKSYIRYLRSFATLKIITMKSVPCILSDLITPFQKKKMAPL